MTHNFEDYQRSKNIFILTKNDILFEDIQLYTKFVIITGDYNRLFVLLCLYIIHDSSNVIV